MPSILKLHSYATEINAYHPKMKTESQVGAFCVMFLALIVVIYSCAFYATTQSYTS